MSENVTNGDDSGSDSAEIAVEVESAEQSGGDNGAAETTTEAEVIEADGIAIEVDPAASDGDDAEASEGDEAAEPEVDPAAERIGQLEAQIATLEAEKKDNWDRFLRATADLENFRKRAKRDVEDARITSSSKVLKEILPVMDNLERALQHAEGATGEAAAIRDGVKLVMRQFTQALGKCDVAAIDALGKPFDPNLHEAIQQLPTDEYPPGSVAVVMQTGYTIKERLLRPSMVVVAIAPPEPEKEVEGGNGKDHSGAFEEEGAEDAPAEAVDADADAAAADSDDAGEAGEADAVDDEEGKE